MLGVTNKTTMLSVFMLIVVLQIVVAPGKTILGIAIMLTMLSVFM
jgi:hypothetical protein